MKLLGADSVEEIENNIKAGLKGDSSDQDIADAYKMYSVTNGPARWVFAKVDNTPRGMYVFNVYCYKWEDEWEYPDTWLHGGYIRVLGHTYTNGIDRELHFQIENENVKVLFRGEVIFTVTAKKNIAAEP